MRAYGIVLGIVLTAGAQALETLNSKELLALCQSGNSAEIAVCSSYINGFIDGAFATDPRVAERIVSEMEEEESFSERAIRTRLGNTLERFGDSYYAGFCISGDLSMETILMELTEAAQDETDDTSQQNARDYLYTLLKDRHPCEEQAE